MTSHPIPGSSRPVSPPVLQRPAAGSRRVKTSALRRATQLVLVLGTVLAVAAAFGPLWLVRTGVVVAVAAGVLACVLAWRELFSARRQHAKAMLAASHEHGAAMTAERTRNAAVVDTLSERARSAGMVIAGQRVTIGQLRTEVLALHGDKTQLIAELKQRAGVISGLRETVAARDAELFALRVDQTAEVHHMPRRVLVGEESRWCEVPGAEEWWGEDAPSTVVDLKMIDTAMVLPNYEDDRRVG